jgi:hypothetical protein
MREGRSYIPEIKGDKIAVEEQEKSKALIDLARIADLVARSIAETTTIKIENYGSDVAEKLIKRYLADPKNSEQKRRLEDISEILDLDWDTMATEHFVPILTEKKREEVILRDLSQYSSQFYRLQRSEVERHLEDEDYDWFLDRPNYSPELRRVIEFLQKNGLTREDKILFAERVGYFNRGEHIEV